MKTYCKGLLIDRDFIERGYGLWLEAPAGKKNAWRVPEEYGSADALLDEIASEVEGRSLSFRRFKRYVRHETSTRKERNISVASVKYQVVTYALKAALADMLHDKIGYYQVAGVKGKGQKAAGKALRKWSRERGYHVKLDVRKCYESITCDMVMEILVKLVASADVLYMAESLLSCFDGGTLEIGTYFALLMALLVLSYAYHFVEDLHKVRRGERKRLVSHQIWHLDDALLMSPSKRDLKMAVRALSKFMRDELGLELKAWKVAVNSKREPLDLCGYRSHDGALTLRRRLFLSARRAFSRFAKRRTMTLAGRCCSYWGWFKNSDSFDFVDRTGAHGTLRAASKMKSRHDRRKVGTCITREAQSPSHA